MKSLPTDFLLRMKTMLGNEYDQFYNCYNSSQKKGIRLNTLKCSESVLREALPFTLTSAPYSSYSYYAPEGIQKIGNLPMHHAGAFYSQEPSASSAVTVLAPVPGDKVLDLCAAPGGKSTQIAAELKGKGLIWSNEIIKNRAMILLSNMERMGVTNAVISSCYPDVLCNRLAGYFDKVLVDAPCSGEGMFRKDPQAIEEWSLEHVKACAGRQLAILSSAANAVKENGIIVYSTCTFSPEENEGVISAFLNEHKDFILEPVNVQFGHDGYMMENVRRIYPMDGGEGHFVAKLKRVSSNLHYPMPYKNKMDKKKNSDIVKLFDKIQNEICKYPNQKEVELIGNNLLLLPQNLPNIDGLGVIRAGVLFGELKLNRIEPAHAFFMSAKPEQLNSLINFEHDSKEISHFLCGEELDVSEHFHGYTAVAVDGVITGFGKCSNGKLKNKYPKGLRNN